MRHIVLAWRGKSSIDWLGMLSALRVSWSSAIDFILLWSTFCAVLEISRLHQIFTEHVLQQVCMFRGDG
jgi:hypothetical protein